MITQHGKGQLEDPFNKARGDGSSAEGGLALGARTVHASHRMDGRAGVCPHRRPAD